VPHLSSHLLAILLLFWLKDHVDVASLRDFVRTSCVTYQVV